jgi:hypothetical protein
VYLTWQTIAGLTQRQRLISAAVKPWSRRFSVVRKATENQYGFRGDRLDDIANFFVVEEQVFMELLLGT